MEMLTTIFQYYRCITTIIVLISWYTSWSWKAHLSNIQWITGIERLDARDPLYYEVANFPYKPRLPRRVTRHRRKWRTLFWEPNNSGLYSLSLVTFT
jgi:hypothetical protein